MKQAISLFLIISVVLQSFSNLIIMAGYEVNKDYISTNLCENKAKPMLHCNGKCHLQKQLKEQQSKEQSPGSDSKQKQEVIQFLQKNIQFVFNNDIPTGYCYAYYSEALQPEVSFSIFHPPVC